MKYCTIVAAELLSAAFAAYTATCSGPSGRSFAHGCTFPLDCSASVEAVTDDAAHEQGAQQMLKEGHDCGGAFKVHVTCLMQLTQSSYLGKSKESNTVPLGTGVMNAEEGEPTSIIAVSNIRTLAPPPASVAGIQHDHWLCQRLENDPVDQLETAEEFRTPLAVRAADISEESPVEPGGVNQPTSVYQAWAWAIWIGNVILVCFVGGFFNYLGYRFEEGPAETSIRQLKLLGTSIVWIVIHASTNWDVLAGKTQWITVGILGYPSLCKWAYFQFCDSKANEMYYSTTHTISWCFVTVTLSTIGTGVFYSCFPADEASGAWGNFKVIAWGVRVSLFILTWAIKRPILGFMAVVEKESHEVRSVA